MLVNQALAVRVFAYARATEALQLAERRLHELIAYQRALRESERQRLARGLHDSLAQNLLALRLDIAALHEGTGNHHRHLHARAAAALDNVDLTLRAVRQLLGELRPAGIELGLQAAVEIEVRKFRRANGIECALEGNIPDDPELPETVVLTACRVLQESLDNVARHARARRVVVRLACTDACLSMTVTDDGVGFDPEAPSMTGHYGLFDLQERVRGAGGRLEVCSPPAGGTETRLSLPLAPPPGPTIV